MSGLVFLKLTFTLSGAQSLCLISQCSAFRMSGSGLSLLPQWPVQTPEGLGPTLGLSHPFSTLWVGRRFPGSWRQNRPCQQSSAASSALELGAGEGEVRWGKRGEGGQGQRLPTQSCPGSSAGTPTCQSQLRDSSSQARAQMLCVLLPQAKDRVPVFPGGQADQEWVEVKAEGGG